MSDHIRYQITDVARFSVPILPLGMFHWTLELRKAFGAWLATLSEKDRYEILMLSSDDQAEAWLCGRYAAQPLDAQRGQEASDKK